MTDGYKGYQAACDDYQIQRLGCWAHARKYFMDAKKIQPKGKTGKADQAITFIQKLFANSQAGVKANANPYSLIQTTKANELNPYEYLKQVFKELPNTNNVENIESLLPCNLSKNVSS